MFMLRKALPKSPALGSYSEDSAYTAGTLYTARFWCPVPLRNGHRTHVTKHLFETERQRKGNGPWHRTSTKLVETRSSFLVPRRHHGRARLQGPNHINVPLKRQLKKLKGRTFWGGRIGINGIGLPRLTSRRHLGSLGQRLRRACWGAPRRTRTFRRWTFAGFPVFVNFHQNHTFCSKKGTKCGFGKRPVL